MKLYVFIPALILLLNSCKKDSTEIELEWKCTEHKALLELNNPFFHATTESYVKFYKVNDSILFLYTNNGYSEYDIFFKILLKNGKLEIIDCRPLISGHIMDISFANQKDGYLLVRDSNIDNKRLLYTHNGGENWQEITLIHNFSSIHFSGSNTGIARTTNKIYKTSDGGNNWEEVNTSLFQDGSRLSSFYLITKKPEVVFISDGEFLYYSVNGGFDWSTHSKHNLIIRSFSLINENKGFVINDSKNIYKIDTLNGVYNLLYNGNNSLSNINARSEQEIYFCKDWKICCTSDGFKNTREMTMEDPFPDSKWDRFVGDYCFLNETGVFVDTKGTLYLYKR
jgi:hypothetical protein